jgi:hypothetical protein
MDESVSECLGGKLGFCFDCGTLFLQVAETISEGEEGGEGRNVELRVVESG